MSKRANGEGSIYKRADGRWVASLTETNGKRKSIYAPTQAEVLKKLSAARKSVEDGMPLPPERLNIRRYLENWLEGKQPSLRPESFRRYKDLCHLHLIPELGSIHLTKLTPAQVQAAYAHCRSKGLSGTTLQHMHGVLHKALEDAVRWNLVVRNVAHLVDVPRRSTGEMRPLNPEEAAALLKVAQGDPLEALYTVALTCGLRLGELQALRWREVDLDGRRLKVTATLQAVEQGRPLLSEPKTERSKREVYLSDMAVASLRRHRARQLESRLASGHEREDQDLVFTNSIGRPLDGNNLRVRSFARLLKKAGLPPMRFHNLRHSAATLLMAEGVPVKVASELLGHADITTTLRIYSHVLPTMQEQAATAMDRLFGVGAGIEETP